MQKTEYKRPLGLRDYHRYARRTVSKEGTNIWMPDVKGLVVIEPAGTVAGQNLLERLTGLGQAFAYFTAGTPGPGLLALDSI